MAFQYLVFADIPVRKEAVGGLGIRPVLESSGQRFPREPRALPQAADLTGHPPDRTQQFPFPPNFAPSAHLNHSVPRDELQILLLRQNKLWWVNQFATQLVGNCKHSANVYNLLKR